MQNKYKLNAGAKRQAMGVIESYQSYKRDIKKEESEIFSVSSALGGYEEVDGERVFSPKRKGGKSSLTENQALRLEALHESYKYKAVQAVNAAFSEALKYYTPELAGKIQLCIIHSCTQGKRFTFEYANIVGISQTTFYNIRNKVIFLIAKTMNF